MKTQPLIFILALTFSFLFSGEVFGQEKMVGNEETYNSTYFERTLSGSMLLEDFNRQFNASLACNEAQTLSDFITEKLRHHPSKGEKILTGQFEMIVLEPSLFGAKTVRVRTRNMG